MKPQEQLVELVGEENAERYVQIVKGIMQQEDEQELEVVNK